jgi:GNAT superfamily N-acetyltransferase
MIHAKIAGRLARHAGLRLFRLFSRPLERRPGAVPAGLGLRLLSLPEVLDLCSDPGLDLRRDAAAAAYARGDLCVAAFDADAVAGYCWLAFAPLPHLDGVWVRFDRRVAWTYKSLVLPSYRGKGIAPALYGFSDADSRERGCGDSVICVESHNRPSISAALRAGYSPSGYGGYLVRGSRLAAWSSPAAKRDGVAFFLPNRPAG